MRVLALSAAVLVLSGCAPRDQRERPLEGEPDAPALEPAAVPRPGVPDPNREHERPPESCGIRFETRATLRRWDSFTGAFLPAERVWAVRRDGKDRDGKDQVEWVLAVVGDSPALPTPKSEVVDPAGTVWVVRRMERPALGYTVCSVAKHQPGFQVSLKTLCARGLKLKVLIGRGGR